MARHFLTMKYHYKASDKEKKLSKLLCKISKNIYNSALYELRQTYSFNSTGAFNSILRGCFIKLFNLFENIPLIVTDIKMPKCRGIKKKTLTYRF